MAIVSSATKSCDTADHVEDLALQIEALDESQIDLVGSSWESLVSVAYAGGHPDKVGRVVEPSFSQSDTDLFPRPTTFASYADAQGWLRDYNPRGPHSTLDAITVGSMRRSKTGALVPRHDPAFLERWPFRNDNHWPSLPRIACPTLMVQAGFTL